VNKRVRLRFCIVNIRNYFTLWKIFYQSSSKLSDDDLQLSDSDSERSDVLSRLTMLENRVKYLESNDYLSKLLLNRVNELSKEFSSVKKSMEFKYKIRNSWHAVYKSFQEIDKLFEYSSDDLRV
jgi:hypothetical protein